MSNIKVPKLRFREFSDEWEEKKLSDIAKVYDGTHQTPNYQKEGVPFYSVEQVTANNFDDIKFVSEEIYKNELKRVVIEKGDILMTRIGDIGSTKYIDWDVRASFYVSLALIKQSEKYNSRFLNQYIKTDIFQRELWQRTIHVAFPKKINLGEISHCSIKTPSKEEQKKIAEFLGVVDDKISGLEKKKELLEKYKKGIMQKIFTQQIHFKDESGKNYPDWEEKTFGEVFDRITRKNKENNSNVLTISAQQGLVNQEDFFNKSVAAKDLTGYYLLEKGEFAYNKSYSKGFPMGAIKKLNKYGKGIVSTLYICFKTKDDNSEEFFEQYFNAGIQNREIDKIAQEGARNHGLLNISVVDFFESIVLKVPSKDEQKKIADFLTAIDDKIELTKKELGQAKNWKKGLLQQMFV